MHDRAGECSVAAPATASAALPADPDPTAAVDRVARSAVDVAVAGVVAGHTAGAGATHVAVADSLAVYRTAVANLGRTVVDVGAVIITVVAALGTTCAGAPTLDPTVGVTAHPAVGATDALVGAAIVAVGAAVIDARTPRFAVVAAFEVAAVAVGAGVVAARRRGECGGQNRNQGDGEPGPASAWRRGPPLKPGNLLTRTAHPSNIGPGSPPDARPIFPSIPAI